LTCYAGGAGFAVDFGNSGCGVGEDVAAAVGETAAVGLTDGVTPAVAVAIGSGYGVIVGKGCASRDLSTPVIVPAETPRRSSKPNPIIRIDRLNILSPRPADGLCFKFIELSGWILSSVAQSGEIWGADIA